MTAAEHIARLERENALVKRALSELCHMSHGPHGLPSLQRQAPAVAAIYAQYLTETTAVGETFVGRVDRVGRETTDAVTTSREAR